MFIKTDQNRVFVRNSLCAFSSKNLDCGDFVLPLFIIVKVRVEDNLHNPSFETACTE